MRITDNKIAKQKDLVIADINADVIIPNIVHSVYSFTELIDYLSILSPNELKTKIQADREKQNDCDPNKENW